jgi:tetratricopeptide (TPR) repeat protein
MRYFNLQENLTMSELTDYQRELQQINRDLAEFEGKAFATPINAETITKFVYRLYQRASLTGSFSEFEQAEAAINKAINLLGPTQDICLLKANLDFKFHRLTETKQDLELGPGLLNTMQGRILQADIAFQEGKYVEARNEFEKLIAEERSWDNLARLAYWQSKMGDLPGAEKSYEEAEDEITAKEMKSFAWVEVQRGLLDLTHGRFDDAQDHYMRADRAYSGYWFIHEHIAEVLGALGRFDEAAVLYEKVAQQVPKPELQQALGQLYAFMGQPEKAEPCFEKALRAYLESAERGHVHYYHHLADFFTDVREDPGEALKWAQMDLQLRTNYSTQGAYAWALYLNHRIPEALETIKQALASGARESGLLATAGIIHNAAGLTNEGERYLQLAAEMNPKFESFHVHH